MAFRRKRLPYTIVAGVLLIIFVRDWKTEQPDTLLSRLQDQPGPEVSREDVAEYVFHPHDAHLEQETSNPYTSPIRSATALQSPSGFLSTPIPSNSVLGVPKVQFGFQREPQRPKELQTSRLQAVKDAFLHSWEGYKRHAWLKDEVAPVTGGHRTSFSGWAATLVDSLDTLWILGLRDEFEHAVLAVKEIDFNTPSNLPINVFETTIRYLGGLLGAYDVTGGKYPVLLQKATEVGDMLYDSFNTPSRMPVLRWSKIGIEVASGTALVAELGSLSLEFTRLSQLTGDSKFFDAVQRITDCLDGQQMQTKAPGLFPHIVNARECDFTQDSTFSIGASADSIYEYFPKQYQLLNGTSRQQKLMYERAIGPIKDFVLFQPMTSTNADILLAGTLKAFRPSQVELSPYMQHLACFAGGMVALAAKLFNRPDELDVAKKLVDGCIWAYGSTLTGIMPEVFHAIPCPENDSPCTWNEEYWGKEMLRFNSHDENPKDKLLPFDVRISQKAQRLRLPKGISAIGSRDYQLRPEAIESIFVLFRITGDERLREEGWKMFQAITNQTKTDIGFSAIEDVTIPGSRKTDKMESFWTAETLKYFYLLFEDPSVISLDEYVFNTEAHPFRLSHAATAKAG